MACLTESDSFGKLTAADLDACIADRRRSDTIGNCLARRHGDRQAERFWDDAKAACHRSPLASERSHFVSDLVTALFLVGLIASGVNEVLP